jgi:hypothetical protein
MAVTLQTTKIMAGSEVAPVAPQLGGATAASAYYNTANGCGFQATAITQTTPIGCRLVFQGGAKNFNRKFIQFSVTTLRFDLVTAAMDTVANGGARLYFFDGSGNYAGFKIYGNDLPGYASGGIDGFLQASSGITNGQVVDNHTIERSRTPDYSSGSIDWSAVVGLELHIKPKVATSLTFDFYVGSMQTADEHYITGGTVGSPSKLVEFYNALIQTGTNNWYRMREFPRSPFQFYGAAGVGYAPQVGFSIGNGSTTTVFTDSFGSVGFWNVWESAPTYQTLGPLVQLATPYARNMTINQSASDVVTFNDFSWSSAFGWGIVVQGSTSGQCYFNRNSFWRSNGIVAAHARFIDCIFDACDYIQINANTIMTGATIRNSPSGKDGLRVVGAPGDWTAITAQLSGNVSRDLSIDPSSAGTFDFSALTVPNGYTLKIHNLSATRAITVKIGDGIAYSTSTAGGAITVQIPTVQATAQVVGLAVGCRLQVYNDTTNTEVVNAIQASSTWTLNYTNGTTFSTGDYVRVRITYQSGLVADLEQEMLTISASTGWGVLSNPIEDTVYSEFGIDGSTCTEFTWDGTNLQIDINDADNTTQLQRIGAWYKYFITTATGIESVLGGISWEKINELRINASAVSLQLDNTKATPCKITGGRIYRSDGQTVIAPASSSIHIDYEPVYMVETGVSGLTTTESAQLAQAASAGNPWSVMVADNTAAGTFGEMMNKKVLTVAKFLGLK